MLLAINKGGIFRLRHQDHTIPKEGSSVAKREWETPPIRNLSEYSLANRIARLVVRPQRTSNRSRPSRTSEFAYGKDFFRETVFAKIHGNSRKNQR
jgi:hypothetical protein